MSGELHPQLSGIIPAFQALIAGWTELKSHRPELAPFINEGMIWINKYFDPIKDPDTYLMASGASSHSIYMQG